MSFQAKTDYCGLTANEAIADSIVLKDDAENLSSETYSPQGQDGSIIAMEVFGEDSAPTNSYAVKADISVDAGDIALNSINVVGGKNYALEQLQISTSAGAAPTISATSQEIETSAEESNQCLYEVPAFALSVKQHAQILFAAFTLTGTGCTLTECSATVGGTINKDKVDGVKIGSDINSGLITVSGTILQTGSTAPTLEAASGWKITKPLTSTRGDSSYKTYSFELQKPLAKTAPTPAAATPADSSATTGA